MDPIVICAVIALPVALLTLFERVSLHRLASVRGKPDICQFARSFPRGRVDTRIMRSVWNALQKDIGNIKDGGFPVNGDDRFRETLRMTDEDIEEIYIKVTTELGITIGTPQTNPYWNNKRVVTRSGLPDRAINTLKLTTL